MEKNPLINIKILLGGSIDIGNKYYNNLFYNDSKTGPFSSFISFINKTNNIDIYSSNLDTLISNENTKDFTNTLHARYTWALNMGINTHYSISKKFINDQSMTELKYSIKDIIGTLSALDCNQIAWTGVGATFLDAISIYTYCIESYKIGFMSAIIGETITFPRCFQSDSDTDQGYPVECKNIPTKVQPKIFSLNIDPNNDILIKRIIEYIYEIKREYTALILSINFNDDNFEYDYSIKKYKPKLKTRKICNHFVIAGVDIIQGHWKYPITNIEFIYRIDNTFGQVVYSFGSFSNADENSLVFGLFNMFIHPSSKKIISNEATFYEY